MSELAGDFQEMPDLGRVWRCKLPTKVKFFGWLLLHSRLNTRALLFHRNIVTNPGESYYAHCPMVVEDDTHIFSLCSRGRAVWGRLGLSPSPEDFRRPWTLAKELHLPPEFHTDVVLLLLCHL
jgi:hypothetical protein